jgi:hypothetical protein
VREDVLRVPSLGRCLHFPGDPSVASVMALTCRLTENAGVQGFAGFRKDRLAVGAEQFATELEAFHAGQ